MSCFNWSFNGVQLRLSNATANGCTPLAADESDWIV
jgi:hypothetical protein